MEIETKLDPIPFLKWAGGKRWLVASHSELFPQEFDRYIEPFLGSGAVFFHLQPSRALLSDLNAELVRTYLAIKSDWQKVSTRLRAHQNKHSEHYYYAQRDSKPRSEASAAARFIYLNRTCWNGLYRVNKSGNFNVPIGTKNSVVLSTDDFESTSSALRNVELMVCDFEDSVNRAGAGDFLFVDPPYTVKHNLNGFLKYNDKIFSWMDQVRLRDAIVRAHQRGARFVVTNANHASIRNLYRGFRMRTLRRSSVISGASWGRGDTEELFIDNE